MSEKYVEVGEEDGIAVWEKAEELKTLKDMNFVDWDSPEGSKGNQEMQHLEQF